MKETIEETFDATRELQKIQKIRATGKKHAYRKSKLMKFRAEIVKLRKAGASLADIQAWLRIKNRKSVSRSTISRYLKNLPEISN